MQYELQDKSTKPEFQFLVRGGFRTDYMLFNDYEEAFCTADSLSTELNEPVFLYESCLACDGEYNAAHILTFTGGRVQEADSFDSIHFKYYTDAGQWLNPPETE